MGFFERLKRVLRSNLNDMIHKAEDPEKMLGQLITDMNHQLVENKKNVATAIADEKKLERQMNNAYAQAKEWEEKAKTAVKAGKDDLAKEALTRKKEHENTAEQYREQWQAQHESVEKLKQSLRQLQQKMEEAQRKKNLLLARSKRADAQRKIQQTIGSLEDNSAFAAFDRLSQEIEEKEARNEAYEELESSSTEDDDLERKFAELEGSSSGSADDMLEDLKRQMLEEDSGKDQEKGGSQ
jgi:phage shock protein A